MVKRVLIERDKFSVSLPGYDVESALLDQLSFDARFSSMRPCERGSLFCNSTIYTGSSGGIPNYDYGTATVYFSKAYPAPPTVVFALEDRRGGGLSLEFPRVVAGLYFSLNGAFVNVTANVYSTHITFWNGLSVNHNYGFGVFGANPYVYTIHKIHWLAMV